MFEVWVNDGARWIDLYPVAEDVLEHAPYPSGMDALRLAELSQRSFYGEYVAVGNFPAEIEASYGQILVTRTITWARWIHKENSMRKVAFDQWEVHGSDCACEKMKARIGTIIRTKDIERVPLNDCWKDCHCWYGVHRPNRKR